MVQNIEIKVRVPNLEAFQLRLDLLGAVRQWRYAQIDTYFNVSHGRLKLRETDGPEPDTLISYVRSDEHASRISHYRLLPVPDAGTLKQMLDDTLGVLTRVRKTRTLYLYGSTRIHLDDVDGLGTFVELETVIGEQTNEQAWLEHRHVVRALQLNEHEPVGVSYSDLMLRD